MTRSSFRSRAIFAVFGLPALLWAGLGCVASLGLLGLWWSADAQLVVLGIAAAVVGGLQDAFGLDIGRLLFDPNDGWPTLNPYGVLFVYFAPATALAALAVCLSRRGKSDDSS